jgi:hypothetical protein
MPGYRPGATLQGLVDGGVIHQETADIFARAFNRPNAAAFTLYSHQEAAIRDVCQNDKNLVVCSGTGSGKTECFLIPLVNYLVGQWIAAGRPTQWDAAGVRAMILYPMNALVNDQVRRLRTILKICDGTRPGIPKITFGKYTGELAAVEDEDGLQEQLAQTLPEHVDALTQTTQGQEWSGAGFDDEAPLKNEVTRRSVWHQSPAHILVTNYSMLERLLLQPETNRLFEDQWKFIILDEAHSYSGALGTEIAWLVRRVKRRIGNPGHLRFMATSATLIDDPGLTIPQKQDQIRRRFAAQLFPAQPDTFSVQFGDSLPYQPAQPSHLWQNPPEGQMYRDLVDARLTAQELANLGGLFAQFPGVQSMLSTDHLFLLTQAIFGTEAWNRRLDRAYTLANGPAGPMAAGDALYLARMIAHAEEAQLLPVCNVGAINLGMFAPQGSLVGLQALVRFVIAGVGALNNRDKWREWLHDYGDPRPSPISGDQYQLPNNGGMRQHRYGNRLNLLDQWGAILGGNLAALTIEGFEYLLKTAHELCITIEDSGQPMPEVLTVQVAPTADARDAVQAFVQLRNNMSDAILTARQLLADIWRSKIAQLTGQQPDGARVEELLSWLLGRDANLQRLSNELREAMANAAQDADRARFGEVARAVFGGVPWASECLDALISLAALGQHPSTERPLLDIRYHQLLRGLRGVGVSFNDAASFTLHPSDVMVVGENVAERAVFNLGACRSCGQPFVLGYTDVPMLNAGANLQFLSRMKTESRGYLHAIAWVDGIDYPDSEPNFPQPPQNNVWLNIVTGQVCVGIAPAANGADWIRCVWYVAPSATNPEFLAQCPCCGDKHDRPRDNRYGLITPYEARGEMLKLTLLDELIRRTDPSPDPAARREPGYGRKVLAFSDSRKGAAGLAFGYQNLFNATTIGRLVPAGINQLGAVPLNPRVDVYIREQANVPPAVAPFFNYANFVAAEVQLSGLIGAGSGFRKEVEDANCARLLEVSDDNGADMTEADAAKMRLLQALRKKGRYSLLRSVLRLESKAMNSAQGNAGQWAAIVAAVGAIPGATLYELCRTILLYLFERATLTLPAGCPNSEINNWSKLVFEQHRDGQLWFERTANNQSNRHGLNRLVREALVLGDTAQARTQAHNVLVALWPVFVNTTGGSTVLVAQAGGGYKLNHDDLIIRNVPAQLAGAVPREHERYDRYLAERPIVPVRAEEHTAQLANERAAAYQRAFASGKINILSCSTTFEMGVDLGDLTCVFLSNLPPGVANYRQRAGRAGRRPGTVAYVLSFVGETPHEQYYFGRPAELLFGRVEPPLIYLSNALFRARHLRAEALHDFLVWMSDGRWNGNGTRWNNGVAVGPVSVSRNWHLMSYFCAGRRGAYVQVNQGNNRTRITATFDPIVDELPAWCAAQDAAVTNYIAGIDNVPAHLGYSVANDLLWQLRTQPVPPAAQPYPLTVANSQQYKELAGPNQPETDNAGNLVLSDQSSRREVQERFRVLYRVLGTQNAPDLMGGIPPRNPTVQQFRLLNEQTITWLTRNRVLPKYGFPVDVIRLLPADSDTHRTNVELERDRKIGLYEYAPGQVVLADKRVYEVEQAEVWLPGGANVPAAAVRNFFLCTSCHQPHEVGGGVCASCGGQVNNQGREAIQPDAFRAKPSRAGSAGIPVERGTPLKMFTGGVRNNVPVAGLNMETAESDTGDLTYLNFGPGYAGFTAQQVGENGRALFHRVKTDIGIWLPDNVLFQPGGGLFALGLNTARLKGAMQSALQAILLAACRALGVSERDIGGVTYPFDAGRIAFVLFDESDGGGGAVLPLVLTGVAAQDAAKHAQIRDIILRAIDLCENCPECNDAFGGLTASALALKPVPREDLLLPHPAPNCRARQSCYKCLRSYHNQRVHQVLDRGDAVLVLRALLCAAPTQVYTPTSDDVQFGERVVASMGQSGAPAIEWPPILLSQYPPPLFQRYPALETEYRAMFELEQGVPCNEHSEPYPEGTTIDVEEVLGRYDTNPSRIVLYEMGIKWCARKLSVAEAVLRSVVLAHELGHWVTHRLPPDEWPLASFNACEKDVKEGWAQLLTAWAIDDCRLNRPELGEAFRRLNERQSAPYRVFLQFEVLDRAVVCGSLGGLRGIRRGALLSDWRRLLNPPGRCLVIPDVAEFTLAQPPRGMPANRQPLFCRIPEGDILQESFIGMVRLADGEYVVGQITQMDGGQYHYMPRNIEDGVSGSAINRLQIVARLAQEG